MYYKEITAFKTDDGIIFEHEKDVSKHCREQKRKDDFENSYLSNFMDYNEFDDMLSSKEFAKYLFEAITERYNFN